MATIEFRPTGVGQATGASADIKDGKFDAAGVPVGTVSVVFRVMQPTGRMTQFDPAARPEPELKDLVPAGKATTSITVSGDKSDLKFEL